jgi:hypothetical protein
VDDPRSAISEHLRETHTEERLRSYRSDGPEAWGIVVFVCVLVASWWLPEWMQIPTSITGAIGLVASIGVWLKNKLADEPGRE